MNTLSLTILPDSYSILRLDPDRSVPPHLDAVLARRQLVSVARTDRELSLVCPTGMSRQIAATAEQRSDGWACFEVDGPLAFSETGILSRLSAILAEAGIAIFVISSFDTDYLMVAEVDRQKSIDCWSEAGISVTQVASDGS